jgi:hypothetical protein
VIWAPGPCLFESVCQTVIVTQPRSSQSSSLPYQGLRWWRWGHLLLLQPAVVSTAIAQHPLPYSARVRYL